MFRFCPILYEIVAGKFLPVLHRQFKLRLNSNFVRISVFVSFSLVRIVSTEQLENQA